MKFTTSLVASLLACVAVARPRASEEGDPIPETSRITAFVIGEDGTPTVECWEISKMVETRQIQGADGTSATAYAVPLSTGHELDGIDILTWPTSTDIWPPPKGAVQAEWFDLGADKNLFSVQGGLIKFQLNSEVGSTSDDVETHIFSMENGDDWFYFEDGIDSEAMSVTPTPYPFQISTISGTETELLRLRYRQQPKHKVVHKGACSFTGIHTPADSSSSGAGRTRVHSPLTVQVTLEDSL